MNHRTLRRRGAVLCGVAVLLSVTSHARAQDPLVDYLSSEVTQENVTTIIQTLQDFGTRYSFAPECDEAGDWVYARMASYGIEVEFEPFTAGSYTMRNVIGRHPGSVNPDQVVIIGAHYDSTSTSPWTDAPGADDNASGVAAVLEAARLLSGYEFENTVEFIAFSGEEQGRLGSKHNAALAAHARKDIIAVINLDMIGYWPASSDMELDIGKNVASTDIAATTELAALTYASIPVHNWPDTGMCFDDHVSYWEEGFNAIVLMDCYEGHANPGGSGESTPYYHTTGDTIETLDLAQTTEAVRAAVSATALLAGPILSPVALHVSKMPAGGDVHLLWSGSVPPYRVEACTDKECSSGIIELTPPGGIAESEWLHTGALLDGVDYYYRVVGP